MTPRVLNAADRGEGPYIRRFTPLQIILHILIIISFNGLVLTGLPLHFSSAPWASFMVTMVGGLQAAALIHRICAVITFGYFVTHVGSLVLSGRRRGFKRLLWGPESMVPQLRDLRDIVSQFKWFLGLGPRPQFERFSYMEKVDYLAVFWGVAVIGFSGLLLWFPAFFSRFLPGWIFNVATIIHGEEALLALSFIFTIHFFNVHLRPEKFPIDLVVFTGRATTAYLMEEHPLEYQRLADSGELDRRIAPPATRTNYILGITFGFAALAVGLFIIGLVLYAVIRG